MKAKLRPKPERQAMPPIDAVPDDSRLAELTPREREVFALLISGKKRREIAVLLGVAPTTVSFHTQSLYRKLGIHDRAQLFIRYALARPSERETLEQGSKEGET